MVKISYQDSSSSLLAQDIYKVFRFPLLAFISVFSTPLSHHWLRFQSFIGDYHIFVFAVQNCSKIVHLQQERGFTTPIDSGIMTLTSVPYEGGHCILEDDYCSAISMNTGSPESSSDMPVFPVRHRHHGTSYLKRNSFCLCTGS